jgi:hypothetical protein
MISTSLAVRLRSSGLTWAPSSGDAFQITGEDFEGDVFTVSDMTIEPHHYPGGTILGFNGTTEWALDSVALEDALWLPREDQLRELLRSAFVSLARTQEGVRGRTVYTVTARIDGAERLYSSDHAAEAYGEALLELIQSVS